MTNRDAAEKLSAIVDLYGIDMSDEENTAIDAAIAALCPVKHPISRTPEPLADRAYVSLDGTLNGESLIWYRYWGLRKGQKPETIECLSRDGGKTGKWWGDITRYDSYTPVIAPEV